MQELVVYVLRGLLFRWSGETVQFAHSQKIDYYEHINYQLFMLIACPYCNNAMPTPDFKCKKCQEWVCGWVSDNSSWADRIITLKQKVGLFKKNERIINFDQLAKEFWSNDFINGKKDLVKDNYQNKWMLLNSYGPFKIIVERAYIESISTTLLNSYLNFAKSYPEKKFKENLGDQIQIDDKTLSREIQFLYLFSVLNALNSFITERHLVKILADALFGEIKKSTDPILTDEFCSHIDNRIIGYNNAYEEAMQLRMLEGFGNKFAEYCDMPKEFWLGHQAVIHFLSRKESFKDGFNGVYDCWKRIVEM